MALASDGAPDALSPSSEDACV